MRRRRRTWLGRLLGRLREAGRRVFARPPAVGPPERTRWTGAILTAALLVTGVSAWAVALIQPWRVRAGEPGLVMVPETRLDPERVRRTTAECEGLLEGWEPPPVRSVRRDPFAVRVPEAPTSAAPRGAAAPPVPRAEAVPVPPTVAPAPGTGAAEQATTPEALLAFVKAQRLELTMLGEHGGRWAVIGGRTYREGDVLGPFTIDQIREGRVRLRRGGTACVLRMQ